MADAELVLSYSAGLVGLIAAAMFVHVYKTATEVEKHWLTLRNRLQATSGAFTALNSNVSELKEKIDQKASYEQTEKRIGEATTSLMLKDKQKSLSSINRGIHVKVT